MLPVPPESVTSSWTYSRLELPSASPMVSSGSSRGTSSSNAETNSGENGPGSSPLGLFVLHSGIAATGRPAGGGALAAGDHVPYGVWAGVLTRGQVSACSTVAGPWFGWSAGPGSGAAWFSVVAPMPIPATTANTPSIAPARWANTLRRPRFRTVSSVVVGGGAEMSRAPRSSSSMFISHTPS